MKRPLLLSLVAGPLMFGVFAASADNDALFDDRYYVAPMGSLAVSRESRSDEDAFGGALAVGKSVMPHLGVEILGDYLHYRGKTVTTPATGLLCGILVQCPDQVGRAPSQSIYGGGIGVNYYLFPDNAGVFVHANVEGGDRFIYNGGLGFDQPFFNRAVYLRLEALYHKEASYGAEPLFHVGVRIPFGAAHEPALAAPQPPVAVVPVEQPAPVPEAAPLPESAPATCQPPASGQPISFEGCKVGDTIVLRGVNFEFNKATLTVNAKTLLDQVAEALLARKDIKIEIDGHTDGKGSVPYNQKLSEARAASVMKYLAGRGISRARMISKGFGKSMPIADNSTDDGRELNRRVELKVTDSGPSTAQPSEGPPAAAPASATSSSEAPAASEASPGPTGEGASAPSDSAQPPSGEAAAAAAPATAEAVPATEPAPAPSEPAAPDQSAPPPSSAPSAALSAETPAPTEPAPAPPDAGPAPASAPSEPAAPDQSTLPLSSALSAAPPAETPAPTEQAPAPPDAGPAPGPVPSEPATADQSAPPPSSAPSAAPPGEMPSPTEQAPAPSESPPAQVP